MVLPLCFMGYVPYGKLLYLISKCMQTLDPKEHREGGYLKSIVVLAILMSVI